MMKKAVMQFTACCLALGISISSFGAVAFADNSMTLAGLSETSTVAASTSMTLAGLTETGTAAASGGDASTAAADETTETTADTDLAADTEAEETSADTTDTGAEETSPDTTDTDTNTETTETLADTTSSETEAASVDATAAEAEETSTEAQTETETELVYDSSMSGEMAFAQCENYINVRSTASTDGEVVGKIYNNNSVTILGQLGDWYEIQSGNVTGYVKADYFATGETADEIAETVAYNVATVNAEGLWIHTEASEDSETIGMAYSSDQLEVVAYEGDWMKVILEDGTYGYVNAWYVDYDSYYSTGETLEEESERLDEEWLEYLAESEAEQERLNEQWLAYLAESEAEAEAAAVAAAAAETEASTSTETYAETVTYTETTASAASSTTLSEAESAVDEAYQAYLEAQEAADAATHQADEQLVYDTYDEAVDAYQDYLNAVAAADELKYSSTTTDTTTTTETTTTAETTQTEAAQTEAAQTEAVQTEAAQTEAAQTEAAQTEAAQTEAAQTEAAATSTSSSSSQGQSIADYAVQFVGNPYVYGGTSLTNGADCSGFTQSVFAHFGISIPRTAASQASSGTSVSLSDIQAGDLLFYSDGSGISHVALYIGGGQVVHASTSSTGIIISSYNYCTPVCARRYWS